MAATRFRACSLPVSVGTDIVSTSRIRQALIRKGDGVDQRFIKRVLTPREQTAKQYIQATQNQGDDQRSLVQLLAGRWAAKEAIIKACTWRKLLLSDVEIHTHEQSHRPYGVILDAQRQGSIEPSGQVVQISISHEDDYATAVCIAAQEPLEGDVGGEAEARGFVADAASSKNGI